MKVYRGACLGAFIAPAFLTLFRLFFEEVVVEASKTRQGTCLGPFLLKSRFLNCNLWAMRRFDFDFTSAQLSKARSSVFWV
jgi:hypothetical protein